MYSIHLMSYGDFGIEIIKHIGNNIGNSPPFITTTSNLKAKDSNRFDTFPEANLYTLATSTYASNLYKSMDYQIYRRGSHWIPIVYDHPYIRVGPIFNPQKGICYSCFEQQLQSNSSLSNYLNIIYDYYDQHPLSGPKGYLPPFIGWARAMYFYVLHQFLEEEGYKLGTFYQLNVTNQHITKEVFHASELCHHYDEVKEWQK